jgi:Flp pilus assembly pilin Flp
MLFTLFQAIQAIRNREEGQALVEYSLILALISVAAVAIMTTVGQDIVNVFTDVSDKLTP